ncbi:MAG: aldo/keto reductase [Nannocystaceae bacterium]
MRYRTLPGTDLQLSALVLGCWAIGGRWWGDDADDAAARDLVDFAWERGITSFDTAPLYGHGHADALLRGALGERRRDAVIITKVGVRWDTPGGHPRSDLSPAHVVADAEASLRRLGIERVPLLLTHWPCEAGTPIAATLEALEGLRAAGKVAAYGLCNVGAAALAEARALAPIAALQTPYSMIRRDFEADLQDSVGETDAGGRWRQGLGVLAYEPLARGLLSGKFPPAPAPRFPESDLRARDPRFAEPVWSHLQPLVEALRRVGARLGVPPAALALAWVLRQPGVSVALVGGKRREQLAESLRALELVDRGKPFAALAPFIAQTRP